jgi:hypothetical protein
MNDNSRVAVLRAGATYLQAIGCLVLLALPASAGDPLHDLLGCPVPGCIGKWCRADYCPKKEPCVCVPLRFGCDDYCGKTAPCVCAPLRFGCDDYRKKCLPKVCCVPHCQYLSCGPTGACGCADCDRLPCDAYPTPRLALMSSKTNHCQHRPNLSLL